MEALSAHSSQPKSAPLHSVSRHTASQIMMFRDQVGVLASWFKGWNECEQTVALLSLLKRVSRTQARFLQLCLEHSLAECTELQVLEGEANNPGRTACCPDTVDCYTTPLHQHIDRQVFLLLLR